MKNRLKYPLSLYIIWHPDFQEGKQIANNLYTIFCRDINEPLSRGLGIPVYFRSISLEGMPRAIDKSQSNRNAIILLIDQNYVINQGFQKYTESIIELIDDNTRIFPIALCDEAFEFGFGLNSYQFIRAFQGPLDISGNFEFSMKKIKIELLHDCARLLMNFQPFWKDEKVNKIPSPVKLFLSHAKKDGLETTIDFKHFIDSKLKLDVFFDTLDIADGYEFEQQIEINVKNSALVVFLTDEYSTREWCRIEVLIAKRNKCPIVVVHDIEKGEKRAFPYLGNTPTITFKDKNEDDFYEIINLTMYQVINNLFQKELLESFHDRFVLDGTEFIVITSPPELFNYIDIYKKKNISSNRIIVLYPEPPLGAEELKILNEIDKDIVFITPIQLPSLI